jgi:hypothetical protein
MADPRITHPEMSRESRAMLLNILWHHQGGSSPVGQPLRRLLGIEPHAHLTDEEVAEAKWIDKALADGVRAQAQQPAQQTDLHAAIPLPPRSATIFNCPVWDEQSMREYAALVAAAPQQPAQQAMRVGRFTVHKAGRSSVDLSAGHADLPAGEYELVALQAEKKQ